MSRDVVITGLGGVSGFGIGIDALWEGLQAGRSCLTPISGFDAGAHLCKLAAEVEGFSARTCVPKSYRKGVKIMARDIELAIGATDEAVRSAGLVTRAVDEGEPTYDPTRMGCHIGAGLIIADTEELALAVSASRDEAGAFDMPSWGTRGMDNLTPLWMLKYLPNMLACHVTILHGSEGPSNTVTCCESSGLLSIGESTRVIQRDAADICFAGGAESKVTLMGVLRLELTGRLAPTGDHEDGSEVVRPFDPGASGTIPGEGGGILILEERSAAAARGAAPICRIAGFGAGQSDPDYTDGEADEGMRYAIEAALADGGLEPDEIDAIVPLGSGIRAMDAAEAGAIKAVFGARAPEIPLVTLTPTLGNCMAGAGGLQAVVGAMLIREQRLPARVHAGSPDSGLAAGPSDACDASIGNVLVCSGAMGGQNAALILSKVA